MSVEKQLYPITNNPSGCSSKVKTPFILCSLHPFPCCQVGVAETFQASECPGGKDVCNRIEDVCVPQPEGTFI